MPISQRMPSVMSLLSNSAMEDQACLISHPLRCPGRMAGNGWNCLLLTSLSSVILRFFGVGSSSLLATSYLVHSACFQHEADQSRGFIASVVTMLWNSNSAHLNREMEKWLLQVIILTFTFPRVLERTANPAAEDTGKYHSPRTNPAQ